jgi:hypothetical protein
MPNTGEDREIIHIQALTIHNIYFHFMRIVFKILELLDLHPSKLHAKIWLDTSRILENVCYGDW